MASSLISSSHHIDFDSVFGMEVCESSTAAATKGDDQPTAQAKESIPWFDLPFEIARQDAEGFLSSDTDEEFIADQPTVPLFPDGGDQPQVSGNSKPVTEEHMSIDDLLMHISEDMMLASVTAAEITKIRLGESISIPGVQEHDLFYASLPRISIHDKGKEILVEDEPVRGNPAREIVELICGDVDFLVQLRDQVMKDVVEFFHSFSLNKLTDLDGLKALKAKDSLMLNWAETDSLEMDPWTATASQIIDLLSAAHSKSLEVLVTQQKENGLPIEQPCTSTYLDTSICSGAVLAQFFSQAKSKCWVRSMVLIYGVWTPIQGNDFLRSSCKLSLFVNRKKLPQSVVEEEFVPHCYLIEPVQYWRAAPSLIKTWGWARVFGFSESSSSDGSTVYRSPSPILQKDDSFDQEELFDSQMHFDSNDFPLDDTTEAHTSLPAANVDLSSLLDDLKSSLSQRMDDANSEILSRLHSTERSLQTSLGRQNDYLRSLIQSARQEGHIQDDVQILRLNELKKAVIAQGISADTKSLAIRNKFNALDEKILLLDGQVAAIRSEQLEFQAKIAADILSLSTQIGDLVDYIRGGDAKKGEGSSSRPQPPPSNVQGQGSGGNPGEGSGPSVVRLTDIADRVREDDRSQMEAERERERQRRIRRLSSGSHKRRRGH
ncbi:hypothetical protein F511_32075 [Dorcoceras hygrometricum]|uniref:Uncharacterized protein n=1 Tax=Dorcoceras hygrometricum TaxID=472368 RepID=A0A2Z7AFP5_9LAMI|nr:hypothetical protein F511_32075 [Dorcoceras hygrometricum]